MKYNIIVLLVLIPLLCQSQATNQDKNILNKDLHFSINTSGGDISGEEGSVSYSIGQVNYLSYNENDIYTTEGVQQPLLITIRPVDIIEEEEFLKMAAYPNPVSNYFIIEASTYTNLSLRYHLSDLNGNLIEEGPIEEPGARIDISRLAVAMYLLNITNDTRHIKTFKIIKK